MNGHLKRVLILLLIFTFVFQMAGLTSLERIQAYAEDEVIDVSEADQTEEMITEEIDTGSPGEIETEGEEPLGAAEEPAEPEAASEETAEASEETAAGEETVTVEKLAEPELPVVEETVEVKAEAKAAGTKAEKTGTVLAFTSDVHNMDNNTSANRLGTWIDKVVKIHGGIDVMAFGGDMGDASGGSNYWTYSQSDMSVLDTKGVKGVYTTGNHEYSPGNYSASSTNATQKAFKIDSEAEVGDYYRIYCLGSKSSSASYANQITSLSTYLSSVENDKVIFIITHFPLHNNGRSISSASDIISVLNDAALGADGQKGTDDDKTIVFLWGHNHTISDSYYDYVYKPGDSIKTSSSGNTTIQFYYGAAGCMSDSEYGSGSAYVKGKGLVVTITPNRGNATMAFTYYDANGNDITESGSAGPVDVTIQEVAVTNVSIDEATGENGQPVEVTTGAGGSIQLNVTIEPANATNKSVTWSSSDPAIATVDQNGKVKGVSAGTATITVTSNDTTNRAGFSASIDVRVAGTTYVLTDTLEGGNDYLIATGNNGNLYVLNSSMNGLAKEAVNGEITVTDEEAETTVFNCVLEDSSDPYSTRLVLGGKYLYAANTGDYFGLYDHSELKAYRYWHYVTNDGTQEKDLLWFFQDDQDTTTHGYSYAGQQYRYYLQYTDAGVFSRGTLTSSSVSIADTDTQKIYLFVKADNTYVDATSVSLNKTTLPVGTGQSENLTATVLPKDATTKQVLWTSSDESVATVDGGIVMGVAEGTAIITATTVNGAGSATCTVTVTRSDIPKYTLATSLKDGGEYLIVSANSGSGYALKNIGISGSSEYVSLQSSSAVQSVEISNGNPTNYISTNDTSIVWTATANSSGNGFYLSNGTNYLRLGGNSNTLRAYTSNSTSVYWTYNSSNSQMTYSSGRYLRYSGSSSYFTTASSAYSVYIFEKEDNTPSITLDQQSMTVPLGETATLTATTKNAGGATVNWTSSNESVATVTNGVVSGISSGSATITASITVDGTTYSAECTVTVAVIEYVDYVLTDTLVDGNQYLIVSGNSGNVLLLSNESTGTTKQLKGVNATVSADGKITIDSITAEKVVFTSELNSNSPQNGYWLKSGNKYLYAASTPGLSMTDSATISSSDNNAKSWHYKADGKNLLWFFKDTSSQDGYTDNSSTYKYYLDYSSGSYFTDNQASTTTLANTNTPAVYLFEKAVDYTLSYNANASDATGATADQTGSSRYTVSENGFIREGYIFKSWNTKADGTGTDYAPGASITLTGDTTLYAQWQEICATHTYGQGQPVWTWTGNDTTGYTAATATFTCSVCGTVTTLTDSDIDVQTGGEGDCQTPVGATTYTAVVMLDGIEYQDEKSVGGTATAKVTSVEANGEYVMAYYDGSKYYVMQQTGSSTPTITSLTELTSTTVTDNMLWVATAVNSFKLTNKSSGRYIYTQQGSVTSSTNAPSYNFSLNDAGSLVYTGRNSDYYYSINSSGEFAAPTTDPETGNLCLYKLGAAQYGPHSYAFQNFTWSEDSTSAEANYKCSVCEDEKAVSATMTNEPVAATCDDPGQTKYTATVTVANSLDGTEHTDSKTVTTMTISEGYFPVEAAASNTDYVIAYNDGSTYHVLQYANSALSVVDLDSLTGDNVTNAMLWTASGSSAFSLKHKGSSSNRYMHYTGSDGSYSPTTATSAKAYFYFEEGKLYYYNTSSQSSVQNLHLYFYYSDGSVLISVDEVPESGLVQLYAFSEGTPEIAYPALGHDWDNPTWAWTGSDAEGWTAATATLTCKRDSDHTTTETAVVTSETEGTTTTYTATVTVDGKAFTDTKEVIAAHVHTYGTPSYEWAADNSKCTATVTCTDCGEAITEEATPAYAVTTAATCTAAGSGTYTASFTNGLFTTQTKDVEIPAAGHTMTLHAAVAPTCTEDGTVEYWSCSKCNKNFGDETGTTELESIVDPATGHAYGAPQYEWAADNSTVTASRVCANNSSHVDTQTVTTTYAVTTPATCEAAGVGTYTATFTNNAFATQTKTVAIEALGHDWEFVDFTWTGNDTDGYTAAVANYKCKNDAAHTQTVAATVTPATTAATCEEAGSTVYTATVAEGASLDGAAHSDTKTVAIEALGHDWEFVNFIWTGSDEAGYTAAVANYKCKRNEAHTQTVYATVTPVTTAATCDDAGQTVYTAEVAVADSLDGTAHNDTKTVAIAALGHKWGTPVWTWTANEAEEYTAAKATFTCENNSEHFREVEDTELDVVTVPATPTEAGSITYTATVTGPDNKSYSDQKVKTLTPTGYSFKDPVYSWTEVTGGGYSCTALKKCNEDPAHNISETVTATYAVTIPVTCETAGAGTYTATFTNTAFETQTKPVEIDALGHKLTAHAATLPTCTEAGNSAYWSCDRCDKFFSDAEGNTEIAENSWVIEATGHDLTAHAAVAATCETAGNSAYWTCDTCGKYFSDAEGKTATTAEAVVIAALGHDWNAPTYAWAADHTSVTATRTCKNNASHTETETVAATSAVTKEATCTESGVETWTSAAFTNTAFAVQTTTEAIPAINHDWNEPEYVWAVDNSSVTATRTCKNDPNHVETETAAATDAITTPATCTQEGVKTWTSAEFTNPAFAVQRTTEIIPKTGHDWDAPTYVWADDYTSVTATRICKHDLTHVETDTAAATGEVTKAATCTETGVRTWTSAAFSNTAFAVQTTTEVIPATGHKWIKPAAWTWTGDDENGYTKVGGTFTCENDPEHVQLVETTDITAVKVDPTPTTAGSITYTAELKGPNSVVYEIQKEVPLPATGYTYKDPVYTWTKTADGYSVKALKECNEDHAQDITETVTASYAVTTAATCVTDGVGTYTAAFTNSAFATQTKPVDIPALGHDWNDPTDKWNNDHTSVDMTFTCKNDPTHIHTETVNGTAITSEITTQPTATAPGVRTYTATVTLDGKTYTVTDTEAIPATGSTVSGSITSFVGRTEEGQVSVQLFVGDSTEAAYTATVNNNETYTFAGVAAGTYNLTVSKKDHVTRTYEITVNGIAVTQDVKIHLLGDVTGDGKLTTADVSRVNSHVRKIDLITDEYIIKCGDVIGSDGVLTTGDVSRINSHVRKLDYIW